MNAQEELKRQIFSLENEDDFKKVTLDIFRFQAKNNKTYSNYLELLKINATFIERIQDIPFLPIEFFKSNDIISVNEKPQLYFESSGTTAQTKSRHYIADPDLYRQSLLNGFKLVYGNPADYVFLALLPSYMENLHSSLIYMVNVLMEASGSSLNGYFKNDYDVLSERIKTCHKKNMKFFLWGVPYALLDLAAKYDFSIGNENIILETGGMKGRGKELVREELHALLSEKFSTTGIHSEYGMTELLSQAYTLDGTNFKSPPWMRVWVRDVYDPFQYASQGQTGAINVIDLANLYSCSFIATDDLGKAGNGTFEILGRLEYADIRGCNLL